MEIEGGILDNVLDQETWLKIFGYLPKSDRANVRLVNSLFNKLICKIEKFKYVLRVKEENLTDIGILMTKRRFNEVKFLRITFNSFHLMAMCDILRVHGKTIEIMTISSSDKTKNKIETISAYRVLSLLELVPNLEQLDWCTDKIQIKDWYAHDPLLEKLKHLRLKVYEETPLEFAYIFTPGTIETLFIECKWKYLKEFVACQSNIKELVLDELDTNVDVNTFNHLKLDSFAVDEWRDSVPLIIQMIAQHPELKKVYRSEWHKTTLPLLRAYCSLVNLERVELTLTNEIINEVYRIAELPNLKEIEIEMSDLDESHGALQVASIHLPNAEKIVLLGNLTNVLILETAGQNWPNLKHLEIDIPSKFENGIDVLNCYLDNFNQLERLVIEVAEGGSFFSNSDDLTKELKNNIIPFEMLSFSFHLQQYPHLKSLTVKNASILYLEHLVSALPNLELLHIDEECSNFYSSYCLINLVELKHLKDFRTKFTEQSLLTRFSTQEGTLMKKLCRRLKSFKIIFGGSESFQESLRTLLEGCYIFTVKIKQHDKLTILENVKY